MASVDNYDQYEWKDAPEYRTTPTNANNFNHMEAGIKKNNTAIKALCNEVATKAENTQTFSQAASRANINSGETIATVFGKIKKWFADLGNLAFKSSNGSTSNYLRGDGTWVTPPDTKYTNGTGLNLTSNQFSVKYGNTAGTACQGNDSRLSNSRPASDVYSWAKAASKPSYAWSEITSKPSTFTPSAHTHPWNEVTGKPSTYPPSSHTHSYGEITGTPQCSTGEITKVNGSALTWGNGGTIKYQKWGNVCAITFSQCNIQVNIEGQYARIGSGAPKAINGDHIWGYIKRIGSNEQWWVCADQDGDINIFTDEGNIKNLMVGIQGSIVYICQ